MCVTVLCLEFADPQDDFSKSVALASVVIPEPPWPTLNGAPTTYNAPDCVNS